MKRIVLAFLAAAFFCMSPAASAEVKEYGNDSGKFKIDLPQGWTSMTEDGAVSFLNKEETASVVVIRVARPDLTPEAFEKKAEESARKKGITDIRKLEPGVVAFEGQVDGLHERFFHVLKDGVYTIITLIGDMNIAGPVADSIDF